MRLSVVTSALVAALVGISGALAVVLAAATAVGATGPQTSSWVTALCLSMALTSGYLSWRHRVPVITAWSTPGAAVIAATAGSVRLDAAVGAFLLAGALIVATGLIRPLERLIRRLPISVAAGMLAGVLVRFVLQMAEAIPAAPTLVLPLLAMFLMLRRWNAASAMIIVIAAGTVLATLQDRIEAWPVLEWTTLVLVTPSFEWAALVGLGIPLYLVTMASQNLPGAAVIKAAGYEPPFLSALRTTGLASMLIAPLGAHTINLAAITAAICTGPEAHPDPARRWQTGMAYLVVYLGLAALGSSLVALFAAFPPALVQTIAGLGLLGALANALASAMAVERERIAATAAFAITASGIVLLGIGSAFWGLAAGLAVLGVDQFARRDLQR